MGDLSKVNQFPEKIEEPSNYYQGLEAFDRVICRNVLMFERLTKGDLQQRELANRMHHRYVLMRAVKTGGVVSVDGRTLRLGEGDALLVSPYQFHHYIDLEANALRWIFITFELERGESALTRLNHRVIHPGKLSHQMWVEIAQLWARKGSKKRRELLLVLDRLLTHIQSRAELASKSRKSFLSCESEWVAQVERLIFESVRKGWTLQQVAEQVGLSERHLRTRFEVQMGISLKDYRSNYQFHNALSLMRNEDFSLLDVAELSGFNSQSVFTRFIRRLSNRTPRELREQVRAGEFTVD